MKQTKVFSVLVGATVLLGFAGSVFAAPFDYTLTNLDSTGTATTTTTITPLTAPGSYTLPVFVGNNASSGFQEFSFGSGVATGGNTISVTPFSIETTDGHLSDTLGIIESNMSSLTSGESSLFSTVGGLGAPLNIAAFMGSNASTSPFIASSTQNGFMSATMASKLTALNASTSIAYEGTTQRVNSFPIFKSATVASGVAVFNLTADGTSGGTALCTNGVIQDSVNAVANDATASYQWSYAFSNSNKTVTITVNKLTTANILTGLLGQSAANGAVIKMSVYCY